MLNPDALKAAHESYIVAAKVYSGVPHYDQSSLEIAITTYLAALPKLKCDGNHAGPPCSDPECWSRDDALPKPEPSEEWSKKLGAALVRALQGDYALVDELAKSVKFSIKDGVPAIDFGGKK